MKNQGSDRFSLSLPAIAIIIALLVGACGGADTEIVNQTPGEGISVTMARANWDTGYFQAAVYRRLLEELGYEVNDPADNELGPDEFYPSLAMGDFDFWPNGWFPLHDEYLADSMTAVGSSIPAGGLQGFLVDKATADEHGIKHLGDIAASEDLIALFDRDGNGLADLVGCNEGWGCHTVIEETIVANGWETKIEQIAGEYSDLWAETVARHQAGSPVLAYTWAPSAFIIELVPGEDVLWLSLLDPLPDQADATPLPPSHCPGQPCQMGFSSADIRVVANNEFLDANPPARRLFELVGFQLTDIAIQNFRMLQGENSEDDIRGHADEWIEKHRGVMDAWLDEARQPGS
jgi:glycine betaine/proline transport system substrate-binding protein